jgi:hypothetical protein
MPAGDIELTHNNQTYDVSDKATATVNLPMEETSVRPSINDIAIRPSQGYEGIKKLTMTAVTAAIDSNIQPENIAYGKTILGVNGSLMPPTLIQKSIVANGPYSAADDDADGYSDLTVNVPSGIPIDEDSSTPLVFGIDSDGFFFSDNPADETPVFFGRDSGGLYVTGGVVNG